MKNSWNSLWNSRSFEGDFYHLGQLISANGFDIGPGAYTVEQWILMTSHLSSILGLSKESKVLEVGCGTGALLVGIGQHCQAKVWGYDYSKSLIEIAQKFVDGHFAISEATLNPYEKIEFDATISHSVFQYFPSHQYAKNVIKVMAQSLKPRGRLALLDICDAEFESNYHENRKNYYRNSQEYINKYENYLHRFYKRDWLEKTLEEYGISSIITPPRTS